MGEQALPRVIGAQSCKEMLGGGGRAEHTATPPRTLSQESLIPLVECYFQGHQLALSGLSPGQKPLSRVVAVEFLCQGTQLFLQLKIFKTLEPPKPLYQDLCMTVPNSSLL